MAFDSLKLYKSKRNFDVTSEPEEGGTPNEAALSFVIQKHWASHLHYDFRLELDGAMKSWAVPKGPSFDTRDKRMAVHVEDHPISYNTFEGQIPEKQYGAGKVIIWDKGIWTPVGDPREGYRKGNLKFELHGHKLHGRWVLVRMKGGKYGNSKQEPWLLIKEKDEYVRPATEYSVVDEMPDSVGKLGMPGDFETKAKPTAAKSASKKAASKKSAVSKSAKTTNVTSSKNNAIPAEVSKSTLPATLSPQLATLVDAPPDQDDDWLYEIKFDGYRMLTRIDGASIRLYTRNGHDWSSKLPELVTEFKKMKLPPGWYDGEIVVANDKGVPDFQALQNAFDSSKTKNIVYYLFDLPYCNGYDLREAPLIERRKALQGLLAKASSPHIHYSETFPVSGRDLVASACHLGLEGVIGKRKNSRYVTRRSSDWIKLKCGQRQEFVIGGYTDPQGSRIGIGSLLLGVHDNDAPNGKLRYTGNVGSGFSDQTLKEIKKQFDALASDTNPFSGSTGIDRKAHWLKPVLLAEVSFSAWTNSGHVRHGVFHGLRDDKKATSITREKAKSTKAIESTPKKTAANSAAKKSTAKTSAARADVSQKEKEAKAPSGSRVPPNMKVSHPERVIDPSTGLTKIDLIRYYALVAPLMMPHLKGRPTSLVRAPDGIEGQLFFQKHMDEPLEGTLMLDRKLDPGHSPLIEVAKPIGLLTAAQMNVIEFHTWNGVKSAIDQPDRMTFDLDPGDGVSWQIMQESTLLMRSFLEQLGLKSFVKTSGGKGMHVVVPLKRRYDWDTIKDFSKAIVEHMAETLPMRFVAKSGPKNRVGKIFIDYLRNGFGATTVAAWSVRSRPGLGVSIPLDWNEVDKLHSSAQWHVANIHTRLDAGNTPWDDYDKSAQNVTPAMKLLGFTPKKAE
jgi:bifunctional non-homologous end joining protein LigD